MLKKLPKNGEEFEPTTNGLKEIKYATASAKVLKLTHLTSLKRINHWNKNSSQ
jgi:hypothetical protein